MIEMGCAGGGGQAGSRRDCGFSGVFGVSGVGRGGEGFKPCTQANIEAERKGLPLAGPAKPACDDQLGYEPEAVRLMQPAGACLHEKRDARCERSMWLAGDFHSMILDSLRWFRALGRRMTNNANTVTATRSIRLWPHVLPTGSNQPRPKSQWRGGNCSDQGPIIQDLDHVARQAIHGRNQSVGTAYSSPI